jgi:hypothetical protein
LLEQKWVACSAKACRSFDSALKIKTHPFLDRDEAIRSRK